MSKRCPRCGYEMKDREEQCPQCGFSPDSKRNFSSSNVESNPL